jgi:hypothetical protein
MTNPDFRALCAELVALDGHCVVDCTEEWADAMCRLRAALAQQHVSQPYKLPEPVAPTDEEIMEVFWEHQNGLEELWADDWPAAARAVLAKWGRQ